MQLQILFSIVMLPCIWCSYGPPYYVIYIDKINQWWPPEALAKGLGIPGYAADNDYNVVNLAFWAGGTGVDAAIVWQKAYTYVSADNPWGNSTAEVQKAWLDLFHAKGIQVCVSAFGSTDMPTGRDPIETATSLAKFVKDNQFDGVDLDYEDNDAMNAGIGEAWLITCTNKLRELLGPDLIISHAPQAPYFMGRPQYPGGGYVEVDQKAGKSVTFYNIQFYNQGSSKYSTYTDLFEKSDGWANHTSVNEIVHFGVPMSKLVIGKPITTGDATNTGYVPVAQLVPMLKQGIAKGWKAGVMGWQYTSDQDGKWISDIKAAFSAEEFN